MATRRLIRKYAVGSVVEERYELTSLLGAGGFATVFEARQVGVGRPVAIKMLDFFWDEEEDEKTLKAFEDRFMREAQVMASIRHPSVVTVFDYGITQDTRQPFIVMELLSGHTFADELAAHGPMSAERLLPLLEPTLDALGELHQQGTIHRDLKPGNWFILSPGTAGEALRILDFGIAAIEEEEGRLTQTGEMVGTYHYMAPEYIVSKIATPALERLPARAPHRRNAGRASRGQSREPVPVSQHARPGHARRPRRARSESARPPSR